jgi:hypothetical protein
MGFKASLYHFVLKYSPALPDNKKDASIARVFLCEVESFIRLVQSEASFHLPSTICTITRAR